MDGTATPHKKKLHIMTWGCQMNVYDSTRMADLLAPLGYANSDTPDDADLVILNTCHIREKASEKIFSELGRLHKRAEKQNNKMMIGVAGCVAQAEGDQILKRAPFVDMVFGPQTYHRLPEMVAKATRGKGGVIDTDFPAESKFDHLPIDTQHQGASAFLSVQEGCDKFCTFCVVPYTRGAEYSRPVNAILEEAKRLIDKGAREITLLGQNVNAYHGDDHSFAQLIEKMAALPNLQRIRYTTSHPRDMDDALITAHRDIPQLMPFIHLPVQSGSTRILNAMNRKHSREDYLALIEKFRAVRPDIVFSSDFIIGFPGETDQDFQDTLALIREIKFAQAYSFKYSPRPGTPAAIMQAQVPEDVKAARLEEVQALILQQQREYNESFMGKTVNVLFDRRGRYDNQIIGRTPYMQSVYVDDAESLFGTTANVTITGINPNAMKAVAC